jgi:pyridoxine 5-phosphate synthase
MSKIKLCVNIDHVATLRQVRGTVYPDPVEAAAAAEAAGAHGITVHLREDRRHIQDHDLFKLKDVVKGKYNLEMALSDEIRAIALKLMPDQITLVPEKREELTTEGGLDVAGNFSRIQDFTKSLREKGIIVSLFIEPDIESVNLSVKSGADYIEFHTGAYADAADDSAARRDVKRIYEAAAAAVEMKIGINAGHGLNYKNLGPILEIPGLEELNIGHSIVARAVMCGMETAVKEMLNLIPGSL